MVGTGPAIPDLRMPALGLAAWCGGLAAVLLPPAVAWLALLAAAVVVVALLRRRVSSRTVLAWVLVAWAVASAAMLRQEVMSAGPVPDLVEERAVVRATLEVTGDPRLRPGEFSDYVLVHGDLVEVSGRGQTHRLRVPVLVIADPEWREVELGSTVVLSGRVGEADGADLAAVLSARGVPEVVEEPSPAWRATATVRGSLRAATAHLDPGPRTLVPALVVGDDEGMPVELAEDFRTTGLTHLLAVSGTNLTLVVGALLLAARWGGVRGRWLYAVGLFGILGFVGLARTEPSVVRAAAMGTVALLGMTSNGRERGTRALGVAVAVLLLLDPWLSITVGFALSALATAGLLLLAPVWRDALRRWLPRWAAEAIAVPAAAQLAVTPVIAGISGEVSLVAVAANLVASPAVAPATVLGLLGGVVGLVWPTGGTALGTLAGWSVAWIVAVAERGAGLPTSSVSWSTSLVPMVGLTLLCLAMVALAPHVLARRSTGAACLVLMVVVVATPVPRPGWPPDDWVVAACDVGQGDGLVLNAGEGRAVVVDVGPDPGAIAGCLRRLGVDRVPLAVLTHFHADHVGGLPGLLEGPGAGLVATSPLGVPAAGAEAVGRELADAGVDTWVPVPGESRGVGGVRLQVLGPGPDLAVGEGEGASNNASVVLLAEVDGVRILLTGDVEPEAQAALAERWPDLAVDVLKVPHHGSRHQDLAFLAGLGAEVALVSVGADNDYGHPAADVLGNLSAAGAEVVRTDVHGDLVVVGGDRLGVATAQ